MSALFKVFTSEQREVFEKHVLPKLWKRERSHVEASESRESSGDANSSLGERLSYGLAFPLRSRSDAYKRTSYNKPATWRWFATRMSIVTISFQKEPQM